MAEKPQTTWQRIWSGIVSSIPVVALIGAVASAIVAGLFNYYGSQTAQAQTIKELQEGQKSLSKTLDERKNERDKQFEAIQQKMLTKELYDAYHKGDIERMERMEKYLERILEK